MASTGDSLDDDGIARTPGRRAGDFVTYREMVEYYTLQSEREHTARAEMAMSWSNAFERLEAALRTTLTALTSRFDDHEAWHRNVMQGLLDRAPASDVAKSSNRMQAVMLVVAGTALLVSIISCVTVLIR